MRLLPRPAALMLVFLISGVVAAADSPVGDDWAYKRANTPAVPQSTARNPIDAFLLKELAKKNLTFEMSTRPVCRETRSACRRPIT